MKANYQQQNRPSRLIQAKRSQPVIQKMAWVITRELNLGLSGISNTEYSSSRAPQGNRVQAGSSHGSSDKIHMAPVSASTLSPIISSVVNADSSTIAATGSGSKHLLSNFALKNGIDLNAKDILDQPQSGNIKLKNYRSFVDKVLNLKFHHRHILFDKKYNLPVVGESDNIGYGGVLYKETSFDGYSKNNKLTDSDNEDRTLIIAISQSKNFGRYNLITNNCQHWVNKVVNTYNQLKKTRGLPAWKKKKR